MPRDELAAVAAPLPIRPLYTVPELAAAACMSRRRALRLFQKLGLSMIRMDRIWLVPLDELERKAPQFLGSVRTAELKRLLS
jgi:AraC-like DNA-binding protein